MKEKICYTTASRVIDEEVDVPEEEESANYRVVFHMIRCCPPEYIPKKENWKLGASIYHKKGLGYGDQYEVWEETASILDRVGIKDSFLVTMVGILKNC